MTIQEIIDYSEIYEHSQDHYNFQKEFYEMELCIMHIKSHDFILERESLSIGQLDQLMVESGFNDTSFYTEQVFIEKAEGLLKKIGDFFKWIGEAIVRLFRGIKRVFTGRSSELDRLEKKTAEQSKTIEKITLATNVASVTQTGGEVLDKAAIAAQTTKNAMIAIDDMADKLIGGGGFVRVIPSPADTSIRVLNNKIKEKWDLEVSDEALQIQATVCEPSYTVKGPALIPRIKSIADMVSNLILFDQDANSYEAPYEAFKIILKSRMNDFMSDFKKVTIQLEQDYGRTEEFTISEAFLTDALNEAERLKAIFDSLASVTDIGPINNENILTQIGTAMQRKPDQVVNRQDIMNDAARRVRHDKDLKRTLNPLKVGRTEKDEFLRNYPLYLNKLQQLARLLQKYTGEIARELSSHLKWRNSCIEIQKRISSSLDEVIASSSTGEHPIDAA